MTEQEWLGEPPVEAMLDQLAGQVSDRKLLLFAVASFREYFDLLRDPRSRAAADVLERLSLGQATDEDLLQAHLEAAAVVWYDLPPPFADPGTVNFYEMGEFGILAEVMAYSVLEPGRSALERARFTVFYQERQARQVLRDIVGNPFRPVVFDPLWLAANDRMSVRLAERIEAERAFDQLPILGDALEEAGCSESAILDHCRSAGVHVPGCWVVDGILGLR
jgi:hypothetical protein